MRKANRPNNTATFEMNLDKLAATIAVDASLSHLEQALPPDAFDALLTQLVILAEVKADLDSGAALSKYLAAATEDRQRLENAISQRRLIIERYKLDGDTRHDIAAEMLLADHELKQTADRQALGKYLDPRLLSRRGKAGKGDMSAFNGWAAKLVAARLPKDLEDRFAHISKLLELAGIAMSRQGARRILDVAKQ